MEIAAGWIFMGCDVLTPTQHFLLSVVHRSAAMALAGDLEIWTLMLHTNISCHNESFNMILR